jgi:DNA-binding MarR family transcriptional regulator
MAALLRHARLPYAISMRTALEAAGFDDIPKNGLHVIGGLARQSDAHPLSRLIADLRLSKQASGQLVDTLVTRGYLNREVDPDDRRRLTIGLTERGRAAAKVLAAAGATVDGELLARIGPNDLASARQALFVLVDIGRKRMAPGANSNPIHTREHIVEIAGTRKALHVRNSDLTESRFSQAKLPKSRFDDVNMQATTFTNINLRDAHFDDVNLTNAAITDANLTGMTINGILVTDLLRAYRSRSSAVLYAKNLAKLQAFYQGVLLLSVEHAEPDHAVLASPVARLTIIQIPESIATSIHIADPPQRRTETSIKLVFEVASIAAARVTALGLGGELDPPEREWTCRSVRLCDGHDPEGNVLQFRQPAMA